MSHFVAMLVFSILLPAIALGAAVVWRVGSLDRERANQQALQVATSVSSDLDREIDGSLESLLVLATSPALADGDLAAFHAKATEAMSYRKLYVLVRGVDGQRLLDTRIPFGTAISRQDLTAFDHRVIATRKPAVSDLLAGDVAQRWVVTLSVPVVVGDAVRYILSMSLEPEHIQRTIAQSVPAAGWTIAVSDSTGRLIARSADQDQHVGREMHPDVRAWSAGSHGIHRTETLSGIEVIRGYVWSKKTGWLVAGFIPTAIVDGPLTSLWRWLATMALVGAAVVLPLSYVLTSQITRPIADAVAAAQTLARGEPVVATPSTVMEANDLSSALELASTELRARTKDISDSELRFRSVFEQSAVGFEQVGLDGQLIGLNDRLCNLLGYTREECLEKSFKALTHPDDWAAEDELIGAIVNGDQPYYVLEKRFISKSDDTIWVRVTSAAVRDVDGKPLYRTSVIEDVTESRKARDAMARLAAIVQASPDAIMSTSLDGRIETWNPGATALFGYDPEDIIGRSLNVLTPRTRPEEFEANLATLLSGQTLKFEAKWHRKDGTVVDVAVNAAPIQANGRSNSISISVEDITERKKRDKNIALLNRELAHRVKNTLAVIQSIANQTMRSTPDPNAFRIAFQGRLQALASANDLLMQTSWDGADLKDFIDRQLAPLMPRTSMQLHKTGPTVLIPADVSVHLGLALHELGTNAIKHGAWSVPGGQVRLSWDVQAAADSETRQLTIIWSEHNGPAVRPQSRSGFGTTLIDQGIPDARIERSFEPSGLTCKIVMSLRNTRPPMPG